MDAVIRAADRFLKQGGADPIERMGIISILLGPKAESPHAKMLALQRLAESIEAPPRGFQNAVQAARQAVAVGAEVALSKGTLDDAILRAPPPAFDADGFEAAVCSALQSLARIEEPRSLAPRVTRDDIRDAFRRGLRATSSNPEGFSLLTESAAHPDAYPVLRFDEKAARPGDRVTLDIHGRTAEAVLTERIIKNGWRSALGALEDALSRAGVQEMRHTLHSSGVTIQIAGVRWLSPSYFVPDEQPPLQDLLNAAAARRMNSAELGEQRPDFATCEELTRRFGEGGWFDRRYQARFHDGRALLSISTDHYPQRCCQLELSLDGNKVGEIGLWVRNPDLVMTYFNSLRFDR